MTRPQHKFRFGVISEQVTTPDAWRAQARQAEAAGYDTFLCRDHFVTNVFGDQFAPFTALMAAAAVTTKLRIGTMVLDNDYRHPVMLAKEAATLDLFSGGRFELGLGAGWMRSEYEQAGMTFDAPGVRVSRLAEAITVLKGLFADTPCSFQGEHYTIDQINGSPKPLQRPHPSLLIGAGSKRMLMLAGREANTVGILTTSLRTGTVLSDPTERLAASVAQKVEWVKQGAGDRFDQVELSLIIDLTITEDRRAYAQQLIDQRGWQGLSVEDVLDMPAIFIGTYEEVVATMLERRARFGFSYYVVGDHTMERFTPIVETLAGR